MKKLGPLSMGTFTSLHVEIAATLLGAAGWEIRWTGVVFGPVALGVLWRTRKEDLSK